MQVDAPELLRPVATQAEWHALQQATAKRCGWRAARVPEDDVLAGDLLLLQPQETLALPFALQVYKSSEECSLPVSLGDGAALASGEGGGQSATTMDSVRCINVRLLNRTTGEPVRNTSTATS